MNVAIKLFSLIIFPLFFSSAIKFTAREINMMREGPAPFFPLVQAVPKGNKVEIIESKENWSKVKLEDGTSGWMANNCLTETQSTEGYGERLAKDFSGTRASQTGIAAAVKGLNKKVGHTNEGDVDALFQLSAPKITVSDFLAFAQPVYNSNSENKNKMKLEDLNLKDPYYEFFLNEYFVGAGVAARLLSSGYINDHNLNKYSYMMIYTLTFKTKYYDQNFVPIILTDNNPDGYACPGGFIFVTKGAFKLCDNEAELAFIFAHELAHVIRKHGMQEMSKRRAQIQFDLEFSEFEEEEGFEKEEWEEELDQMAVEMYNRIVNKRLLEYELEADKIAIVLLANAGYDPFASISVLQKLWKISNAGGEFVPYKYSAAGEMQQRLEAAKKFCEKKFKQKNPGVTMASRFTSYKSLVR